MTVLKIVIDASNIKAGGGLNHLKGLLSSVVTPESMRATVIIFSSKDTLSQLKNYDWLHKCSPTWCNGGFIYRLLGQQIILPFSIRKHGANALFSAGGTLPLFCSVATVTLSQNMLPFEPSRARLFGRWSVMCLKMRLLRIAHRMSFRRADGVIFLSMYAQNVITKALGLLHGDVVTIPHGVESRFFVSPSSIRYAKYSKTDPLHLLYVSIQMPYKHHIELMRGVSILRKQGRSVVLQMIGAYVEGYGDSVRDVRLTLDPEGVFLQDLGQVEFDQLHNFYRQADIFVFPSSCENLPNILIEAMASGLPIASSDRGPMPEILGEAGVYFNPESPASIAQTIAKLADDPRLREELAQRAWERAQAYSWVKCASATFEFISRVAMKVKGN